MISRGMFIGAALSLLLAAGCGASDQTVNSGANGNPSSDGGADGNGVTLQVAYESQSVPVDLGTLATSSYKGVNLVKLSDVWAASGISADRSALEFEFVGADGFKPSIKGCADLSGILLDQGYIDPTTRNLTWDETLGFSGCYSVKGAAKMNAHAPVDGADSGAVDAAGE